MMKGHPIPFAISLERLFREDFVFEHMTEFGVARSRQNAKAIIQSDRYGNPRIVERQSKGGFKLPDSLIDQLGLMCFNMLSAQMQHTAGESGWWVVNDLSPHVRQCFDSTNASRILQALSGHVQPGVTVMNMCVIDGDDPY